MEKITKKIFESTAQGKLIQASELLDEDDIVRLKGRIHSQKQRKTLPPVVTHNMVNDNDEILQLIRSNKLFNGRDDRVKIIYHPGR